MKKSLYFAALGAALLASCSDGTDEIFEQSAAERLENYKTEYAKTLTQDGGLWEVEYFSNEEEPGYVFIMKFNDDSSVEMTANHKWIGNVVKSETSLWKMIADNGPVLSFNSYNNLFHIFSDPKNITGEFAPTTDNGQEKVDIDETGYGHEGDYEFQVMEVSEDKNTIRLMGKKYLYYMYMRRLDANTDVEQYLNELKEVENNLFSKKINTLVYTDASGERFIVKDCNTGVMSIYPEAGDAVDQTSKGNFIITRDGIRFMRPFTFVRADGEECQMEQFKLNGNLSLENADEAGAVLNAGSLKDVMYNNQATWSFAPKDFTGEVKECFDDLESELKTLYGYKSAAVTNMSFEYDAIMSEYVLKMTIKYSKSDTEIDRYVVKFEDSGNITKIKFEGGYDDSSMLAYNAYSNMRKLIDMLTSEAVTYLPSSDCAPVSVFLSTKKGDFKINVK